MTTLSYAITSFLYLSFLIGLILCFLNSFKALAGSFLLKQRLPANKYGLSKMAIEYLNELVFLATGKEEKGRVLLGFSLGIFFFIFTFSCFSFNFPLAMLLAFLSALVPYLSLVSKIQKQRNESSKEGLSFVSELLRQYRIENKNILTCLEKTAASSKDFPFCGKQCYLLLLRLRSSGSKNDIKVDCKRFADSIGFVWARNLSQLIEYAIEGTDISEALGDIIGELMKAKERLEEGKRLNAEAWRMSAYLVPIIFFASIFLAVKFLRLSLGEFLKNQFFTPIGFLLFMLCLLLFCINNIIISFVVNRNIDI